MTTAPTPTPTTRADTLSPDQAHILAEVYRRTLALARARRALGTARDQPVIVPWQATHGGTAAQRAARSRSLRRLDHRCLLIRCNPRNHRRTLGVLLTGAGFDLARRLLAEGGG